jgi:orotidine-5'-phosphate decarboxylase
VLTIKQTFRRRHILAQASILSHHFRLESDITYVSYSDFKDQIRAAKQTRKQTESAVTISWIFSWSTYFLLFLSHLNLNALYTAVSGDKLQKKQKDFMSQIIVPLDVSSKKSAKTLVSSIGDAISWYKVGLELFTSTGPDVIHSLIKAQKKVFLDLKLHDIPNTVARAVTSAANLGVSLITIHAGGGSVMMRAAREAADQSTSGRPKILAVTTLTSMDESDLKELGILRHLPEHTEHLAQLAMNAGMDGVVCSPHEAAGFRKKFGDGALIVTPGVRPLGTASQDQKRIATPREAVLAGANYLVIGRPITGAKNPREAATAILEEMRND